MHLCLLFELPLHLKAPRSSLLCILLAELRPLLLLNCPTEDFMLLSSTVVKSALLESAFDFLMIIVQFVSSYVLWVQGLVNTDR